MITQFQIISAATVPENYTWDKGIPFTLPQTTTTAYTTTNYISGYAPGVKVLLKNISIPNPDYLDATYEWNFGDYYNNTGITTLSCLSFFEHTYLLPGKYTISLIQKQIQTRSDIIVADSTCRGLYGIRWFWDELQCTKPDNLTWNQLTCTVPVTAPFKLRKWWVNETDCFQKHCRFWSWQQVACDDSANPVTWTQAQANGVLSKKWEFEKNDIECTVTNAQYLDSSFLVEDSYILQNVIEVVEILPVAGLYSLTQPTTGNFPYTVQITPRTTKPGSFPIERIDWNMGDGTPTFTVSRLDIKPLNTIFTNIFSADPLDVRNYDITHTYTQRPNTYPVFYPSLTCYSANTNSSDSCCITIGPISPLSATTTNINLLKVKNSNTGNLYAFSVDNYLTFNSDSLSSSAITPVFNKPPTKIRNSYNDSVLYFGNSGANYPVPYTPQCI